MLMYKELFEHQRQEQFKGFQFYIYLQHSVLWWCNFFVIIEMVRPDTLLGCSDIKSKLEKMKISHFKYGIPKSNLKIVEWRDEIFFTGKPIQKLWGINSTSTPPHHSWSSRTAWIPGEVGGRRTSISKHTRWGPWPWRSVKTFLPQRGGKNKYNKYDQILDLVRVAQNISDYSKK